MKRIMCYLFLMYTLSGVTCSVFANQDYIQTVDYTVKINDEEQKLINPVVCIHDRTYLPVREIAEMLNLYVVWDEESQTIKISDIGITDETDNNVSSLYEQEGIAIPVNFTIKLNGYRRKMDNALYTIQNRTYLPLRELAELLGAKVDWNQENRSVLINLDAAQSDADPVLIPFEKNGYYGYADDDGQVIIEAKYKIALPFSEGLAAVADDRYKFGYIDNRGNLVIPHQFFQAKDFSEGLAVVAVSDWDFGKDESEEQIDFVLFQELADSYFYIDKTGRKAFEKEFRQAGNFCNGLAPVVVVENYDSEVYNTGDYAAYIDQRGKFAKIYKNTDISAFKNGYAFLGKSIINTDFETVFDGNAYEQVSLRNGFVRAKKNGKWGVVDLSGNVIINFNYDNLSDYSEGLFAFKASEGYGYIDINENIIISPLYDYADEFIDGRAIVVPKENKDIMYFINNKGEQISKAMERNYFTRKESGLTMVYVENRGHYVNTMGELIEDKID